MPSPFSRERELLSPTRAGASSSSTIESRIVQGNQETLLSKPCVQTSTASRLECRTWNAGHPATQDKSKNKQYPCREVHSNSLRGGTAGISKKLIAPQRPKPDQ